ncbi:hypothetical protein BJ912DRAFT_1149772 [Pholiota molesta]|nr:hypothetical protein BJ912DRAFT_1149772 [Pholiota molesta]
MFSKLKKKKDKKRVLDTQMAEWTWKNDHGNLRVFSVSCQQNVIDTSPARLRPCSDCTQVFKSKLFKNALRRPTPKDENFIYTNHRYRSHGLGKIYARTVGVKAILEHPNPMLNPYIRFAEGAINPDKKDSYNNEVFNGLVEAMVQKFDREERGVGKQNFQYAPAWEEMCHIIRIQSPRAYKLLRLYFPMPDERSLRRKEARQPRFPMGITERNFELVEDHLKSLDYDGPLALSCDDTKLFATFCLYWDSDKNSYFLAGGTDGPLRVTDPESVKEVIETAKAEKATKVRVWCLTLPIPKISPIIVAALPMTSLDAPTLVSLLTKVIDGLFDRNIYISSYACDGTEVERAVQRLFLAQCEQRTYTVKSPRPGSDTHVTYGICREHVICMIQDSKHALKTLRNNLFSGARLLTFGNFTMVYQHILELARGDGTPLYKRDVENLDQQDDNAAVRLFSADALKYLSDHHPNYVGDIVYLFVFGELVDAYQNRSLPHIERVKMVLRARYFLNSWQLYLQKHNYPQDRYFLSREAVDILHIVIEGFLALIIIYRDELQGEVPLLPWLHSSEPCEHVFGESRDIVKDFTFLDFIYMIPKLRVKLHEAVLRGKSLNAKATASGYSHTYFDNHGLNLVILSTFPSDAEIQVASQEAFQEADSLIALLGVQADALHSPAHPLPFPSIDAWAPPLSLNDNDNDSDYDSSVYDNASSNVADELQELLDREEDSPVSRSEKVDETCMRLTSAALALAAEEATRVHNFADADDSERLEEVIANEYSQVHAVANRFKQPLPPLHLPDQATSLTAPGHGSLSFDRLDFDLLVQMRRQHQTKQAAQGVRTKLSKSTNDDASTALRTQILREMHIALKEAQDTAAVGTGLE